MKKGIILVAPTAQPRSKPEQFTGIITELLAKTPKESAINIVASLHVEMGNTADSVKEALTRAGFPNITMRGNSDLSRPLSDPRQVESSITESTADIYIVMPTLASHTSILSSSLARKVTQFNPAA